MITNLAYLMKSTNEIVKFIKNKICNFAGRRHDYPNSFIQKKMGLSHNSKSSDILSIKDD